MFSWLTGLGKKIEAWVHEDTAEPAAKRPNILMIVVDDLGVNDTDALFANANSTPSIRAIAEAGVRFERHYADATCAPSRVAILTGRYPERSGFRQVGAKIPDEFPTLAQALSDVGYQTYLTGKWHAGETYISGWPQAKGFERWFGFLNQWELSGPLQGKIRSDVRPTYNNPWLREDDGDPQRYPGHLTDILSRKTLGYIREAEQRRTAEQKPWFIYHAFLAPHDPIQPAPRFKAQFPATPEGEYLALVAQLDDAVGQLLAAVKDIDNTLVLFVSDNGGTNTRRDNNYPFYGKKNETYEGSFRTPMLLRWDGVLPAGRSIEQMVANIDIYPTLLAAAGAPIAADVDGQNLLPTLLNNAVPRQLARSWEQFNPNVETLSASYVDEQGNWRLSSMYGLPPFLYDLGRDPAGAKDVAAEYPERVNAMWHALWKEHWRKSRLPVHSVEDSDTESRHYSGLDHMRSPNLYGFSIGLEIGPLSQEQLKQKAPIRLAQQGDLWHLDYDPTQGLRLQLGESVMVDSGFQPQTCTALVITGDIQPGAFIVDGTERSIARMYRNGERVAHVDNLSYPRPTETRMRAPTTVYHGGRALFSNMMLSADNDPYEPDIEPRFRSLFVEGRQNKTLMVADVSLMNSELCQ